MPHPEYYKDYETFVEPAELNDGYRSNTVADVINYYLALANIHDDGPTRHHVKAALRCVASDLGCKLVKDNDGLVIGVK